MYNYLFQLNFHLFLYVVMLNNLSSWCMMLRPLFFIVSVDVDQCPEVLVDVISWMVNKLNIRSTLNFKIWFVLIYLILFNQEKIRTFYLLNLGFLLYSYIELFFFRRSIQSKNNHDNRAFLSFQQTL